jgi:hypothetical protein
MVGAANLGATCSALSSISWSPGNNAKSPQISEISFPSIRKTMILSPPSGTHPLCTIPTCASGSGAPSYICRGLVLKAQPLHSSPISVTHPARRGHDDVLTSLIGAPFREEVAKQSRVILEWTPGRVKKKT